jgi:NAD dependent epimerase/dehydratase family enzyme
MADEMLLGGARAEPRALTAAGFQFEHPHFAPALQHALE